MNNVRIKWKEWNERMKWMNERVNVWMNDKNGWTKSFWIWIEWNEWIIMKNWLEIKWKTWNERNEWNEWHEWNEMK